MQRISAGAASYLIGSVSALADFDETMVIRDPVAALNVLRQCAGDHFAMQMLRRLVTEPLHADVNQLNDVAIVELAASLVCGSRLRLAGPIPRRLEGLPAVVAPAAAAPAPAPPRAASPPSRSAPAEAAEPSFRLDLDAALLAAMLRGAAQDGTPFCEECARAARAA